MSHKTLVNGTTYDVKGGKCLVNGTVYSIKKGRTLIGGTGYDIALGPKTWLIKAYLPDSYPSGGNLPHVGYVGPPFTSGGNSYLGMSITLMTGVGFENRLNIAYWYLFNGEAEQQSVYTNPSGWKDEAYRTVTFEEEPTGDLLAWLEANAVLQQ